MKVCRIAASFPLIVALGVACGSEVPPAAGGEAVPPDAVPADTFGGTGDGGTQSSLLNPDSACAQTLAETKLEPLDIYFMVDHSQSMGSDCALGSNGTSKWCYATNALAEYFRSPQATGHRAALQYFTLPNSVCATGAPHGSAAVGLTPLPVANGHALLTNLAAAGPVGGFGTEIESAERGIVTFTRDNRVAGRTMVGVLITDGDPNGCDSNLNNLAAILSGHLAANKIRTFVIGMTGASASSLEVIAQGGGAPAHGPQFCEGTSSCHYYSVGNGEPAAFAAALAAIQAASLSCTMNVPVPAGGRLLDPNDVKVEYTAGSGAKTVLKRVPDAGSCAADGWFYDDNANPKTVNLCPAICSTVGQDASAKVNVLFGCRALAPVR